jgi:hypothetical protein
MVVGAGEIALEPEEVAQLQEDSVGHSVFVSETVGIGSLHHPAVPHIEDGSRGRLILK